MKEPQKIAPNFNREVKKTAHEIRVREKQERVSNFTNQYFERNFDRFYAKAMDTLIKKSAPAPSLQPSGMGQPQKPSLSRTATQLVKMQEKAMLNKIKKTADRMINGKDKGLER